MSKKTDLTAKEIKEAKKERLVSILKSTIDVMGKTSAAMAHAHPITMALMLMTGAQIGHILVGRTTTENAWIHVNIDGIYNAGQLLGSLSATVPIVAGGLNLVGQYLATRGGGSP